MAKIYKGQTIMIDLIADEDLSSLSNTIKYIDPNGDSGQFTGVNVVEHRVQYITTLNTEGVWTFWIYSVGLGGEITPSEPVRLRVYREGE